jgi:hypothetical protein
LPALAKYAAQTSPLWPPPMMITSNFEIRSIIVRLFTVDCFEQEVTEGTEFWIRVFLVARP